jgi:hypothetical protein
MKSNSQSNTILNDEIEKEKEKTKSTGLTRKTRDLGHESRNSIKINSILKDSWLESWNRNNILERIKKQLNLIKIKMLNPAILVMRLRYPYIKQINVKLNFQSTQCWMIKFKKKP